MHSGGGSVMRATPTVGDGSYRAAGRAGRGCPPHREARLLHRPAVRKWDDRVYFDAVPRPAGGTCPAGRLWDLAQARGGVEYLG
jgi:hypothetical protein